MSLFSSAARVHESDAVRLTLRDFQICIVYPREERPILALEAALVGDIGTSIAIPAPRPLHAGTNIRVHQNGEVRLQAAAQRAMKVQNHGGAEFPTPTLVGFTRIREPIAKHNLTGGKRGQDHFAQVLGPRREHQRKFRVRIQPCGMNVEQQLANSFSGCGPARFASCYDVQSATAQHRS